MKFRLMTLLPLLACPVFLKAQDQQQDLRTLLQDSAYVFNRYQEATIGLDVQIDNWNRQLSPHVKYTEMAVTGQC